MSQYTYLHFSIRTMHLYLMAYYLWIYLCKYHHICIIGHNHACNYFGSHLSKILYCFYFFISILCYYCYYYDYYYDYYYEYYCEYCCLSFYVNCYFLINILKAHSHEILNYLNFHNTMHYYFLHHFPYFLLLILMFNLAIF
jgi:hypothetical protein